MRGDLRGVQNHDRNRSGKCAFFCPELGNREPEDIDEGRKI